MQHPGKQGQSAHILRLLPNRGRPFGGIWKRFDGRSLDVRSHALVALTLFCRDFAHQQGMEIGICDLCL